MARNATRRLKAAEAARKLAAAFEVRHVQLTELAAQYLELQESEADRAEQAQARIREIQARREREQQEAQEKAAGVVAGMRALKCSEGEIGERLGLGLGEVRRLIALGGAGSGAASVKASTVKAGTEKEPTAPGGAAPSAAVPGGAVVVPPRPAGPPATAAGSVASVAGAGVGDGRARP